MSNSQSGDNARTGQTGAADDAELQDQLRDDPVLQGHSALNDPELSGSTASSWTGTGGPDPGGMAGPAALDDQGATGAGSDGSSS